MKYIPYADQLKDPRWQKKRLKIFERDDWTCQLCGDKSKTLCVHHRCYRKCYAWEYKNNELETLCEECHEQFREVFEIARKANPNRAFSSLECFKVMEIAVRETPDCSDGSEWWKQRMLAWMMFEKWDQQ